MSTYKPSFGHLKRTPLTAKLGIASFLSLSLAGFGGFFLTTLTRQSAQFLALAVSSAASAGLIFGWTIRRRGVITLLPQEMEAPLLSWNLIEAVQFLNESVDIQAIGDTVKEIAPLVLAKNDSETERVLRNMSTQWQRVLTTRGLLGLFPPHIQRLILPTETPLILPPAHIPEGQQADLDSQTILFQELLKARVTEFIEDLAVRSRVVAALKLFAELANRFYNFIKANTSSDLQVTVIMSVMVLLTIRISLVFLIFSMKKVVNILIL